MPRYTIVAQLRNLHAPVVEVQFREFALRSSGMAGWERVAELFGARDVVRDDWFYERSYESAVWIPPQRRDPMVRDLEDVLFLLRLFRTGNLAFMGLVIESDNEAPLRLMWNRSMAFDADWPEYEIDEDEVPEWEAFATNLRAATAWNAPWFSTARRFFTHGAAKPVNTYGGDGDRFVDYCVVLEATLVPETDRVGVLLRRRVEALLGTDYAAGRVRRLTKELYGIRSSIVHGRELSETEKEAMEADHLAYEQLVRDVLIAALRRFPADEEGRSEALVAMADLSAEDRISFIEEKVRSLRTEDVQAAKARLLKLL